MSTLTADEQKIVDAILGDVALTDTSALAFKGERDVARVYLTTKTENARAEREEKRGW